MWTETTRQQYRRYDLRYASDMSDVEWALIAPHLPAAKRLGRPRRVALRAVVEALLYLLRTAAPWRLLPRDFPNRSTVADGGYAGDKLAAALAGHGRWQIESVKRSDRAIGFEVLPRRWVVERTFAWLGRNRRLAKDFEATIASSEARSIHN